MHHFRLKLLSYVCISVCLIVLIAMLGQVSAPAPVLKMVSPQNNSVINSRSLRIQMHINFPEEPPLYQNTYFASMMYSQITLCFQLEHAPDPYCESIWEIKDIKLRDLVPGHRKIRVWLARRINDKNEQWGEMQTLVVIIKDPANLDSAGLDFGFDSCARDGKQRRALFDAIYRYNIWKFNGVESQSGVGSSIESTKYIRKILEQVLIDYEIKTMLDIGCGDVNWMSKIKFQDTKYTGSDISQVIIEENKMKHRHMTFMMLDAVAEKIPDGQDLLFCREMMYHLSAEDNLRFLANVDRSGAKYFMATTYLRADMNQLPYAGAQGHRINLFRYPYCLRDPIVLFSEEFRDDLFMGLWRLDQERSLLNNESCLSK